MLAVIPLPKGQKMVTAYNNSLTVDAIQPAMVIWYSGTAVPSISFSTPSYTFKEDGSADTSLCTSGVADLSNASYDTVGELADAINADTDGNWHCVIGAALRATLLYASSTVQVADFSSTAPGRMTAIPVYRDINATALVKRYLCIGPEVDSSILNPAARISSGRRPSVIRQPTDVSSAISPRCQAFLTNFQVSQGNAGTNAVGTLKFYTGGQGAAETQLLPNYATADATLITKSAGIDFPEFSIISKPNQRLIMELDAVSSGALNSIVMGITGFYCDPFLEVGAFPG